MTLLLKTLLSCLLFANVCRAQCPGGVCPPQWQPATSPPMASLPRDAVCRVANGSNLGSGTLIARDDAHGYVLTCFHLFREGTTQITVRFPNGRRYPTQLLAHDAAHDLALLKMNRPDIAPATFDESPPYGTLTACGYGGNGIFHAVQGPVVGAATSAGAQHPSTCLRGSVVPGDSGGPVFNNTGKLVGVVWGVREGVTYAMCGAPVRDLLRRIVLRRENNNANNSNDSRQRERTTPIPPPPSTGEGPQCPPPSSEGDGAQNPPPPSAGEGLGEGAIPPVPFPPIDFTTLTLTKLLVTTLGLSSPVGFAIIAASFLLRRRLQNSNSETKPIAIDSPPLPQRTMTETHYVPYERDAFAKAHQWASEQVARKFPGAVEILTALDSLIKQQLNARGP